MQIILFPLHIYDLSNVYSSGLYIPNIQNNNYPHHAPH